MIIMIFKLLYVIFIVVTVLNYIFLDIKVDKIKKESLDKDKVIGSLMAHNQVLRRLNNGFKEHERRLNNVEERLLLSAETEHSCKDCTFYNKKAESACADGYFRCEKLDYSFRSEAVTSCNFYEKKESLDEDENVVYANNVKIDISPKGTMVYKTDSILQTYEDYLDHISKLFLNGSISAAEMNRMLEMLKQ